MTREVIKMKRTSQKTRRRTAEATPRGTGRCPTATRFTTTITARLSEGKHEKDSHPSAREQEASDRQKDG